MGKLREFKNIQSQLIKIIGGRQKLLFGSIHCNRRKQSLFCKRIKANLHFFTLDVADGLTSPKMCKRKLKKINEKYLKCLKYNFIANWKNATSDKYKINSTKVLQLKMLPSLKIHATSLKGTTNITEVAKGIYFPKLKNITS